MLSSKKSPQGISQYFSNFKELLFPNICHSCGGNLSANETVICVLCEYSLPKTNFHKHADNPIARKFWGRLPFQNATSLFYFDKGNKVQHLIHQLKYRDKKEIGNKLGEMLGNDLIMEDSYTDIKFVLPIPLHEKKQKIRGYNQSEYFAAGIAEGMKISYDTGIIYRALHTETQTGKNRLERWENVKDAFYIQNAEKVENTHVLLVDDVLTTGATLEACGQHLTEIAGLKLSIATIAFAHQ